MFVREDAHTAEWLLSFMLQRRAVFLVGYMGAGKTSVGRFVAERLKWTFIDLDQRIESRAGLTVAQIFARDGEPSFRRLEAECLTEVVSELTSAGPTVVALGGGALVSSNNAALLQEFGAPVIWLDAPAAELWARTQQAALERPLRRDFAEFSKRYAERIPGYSFGTHQVNTVGKTIDQVAAEIVWLISIGCAKQGEHQ